MSDQQTNAATAAFDELMPVFRNNRCANCHNKIDPFVPRGHPDMREALQRFRDRRVFNVLARDGSTPHDRVYAALTRYLSGQQLSPGQRGDFMFGNMCAVCHDAPPDRGTWRMAPPEDSFHDKDRLTLCRRIHRSPLTDTPAEFTKHVQSDGFILVAFAGTRGLNGVGEGSYEDTTRAPYAPAPIRPQTHAGMMTTVREWLNAHVQGDKYPDHPECGCRPFRYALKIEQIWTGQARGGVTYDTTGKAETKLPLKFQEEGRFTAEGDLAIDSVHKLTAGDLECNWKTKTNMSWRLRGLAPANAGAITIEGIQEADSDPPTGECKTDGETIPLPPRSMGPRSIPLNFQIDARVGATYTLKIRSGEVEDAWLLTLVEDH